ncbi:Na+-driven multidrug efflux pump [Chitinophaga eiseniae]|uniref:Na+-driven multidrug efflux pump n=1 Tax=Chitinophaga eiseniae TaxID=634771 RepID=A0A1T4SM17_9BACT|nr:MATE family efflux transporter [Chitinophaga eiseniae]SKA29269.1 Na+-driven multidrug efflux pump [Chitinophaga eiseniae]
MQAANRVILNTGALYGRMLLTVFISLYATRLILNQLGAADYGLFNLVGGVITMLSFLNIAMTISTQRYMSFHIGTKDSHQLKMVFNTSVLLHFILGIAMVLLFEVAGHYLFDHVLNYPAERTLAARIIYQFMIASAFFTIVSVPCDATLIAQENMVMVAILGVVESLGKLLIAVALQYTGHDKLIAYGAMMASLTILLLLFKQLYCAAKYPESRISIKRYFNRQLLAEMFTYAGWNMFGAGSVVARNQGLALVLNVFFGAIVNAAYGIAYQVNAQLSYFSVTMLRALNPQIIKSEGSGDRPRMLRLAMIASKFSFYLLSFFAVPLMIEMPFVLQCWLKQVPEYTVMMCRLIVIATLINQLSAGIQVAVQSVGKIRQYQVAVSTIVLLNLPVAWLLLSAGYPPSAVLISTICIEMVSGAYRMMAAQKITGLSPRTYARQVVLRAIVPVLLSAAIAGIPQWCLPQGFVRLGLTMIVSALATGIWIRLIGLTPEETTKLEQLFSRAVSKLQARLIVLKAN